MYKVLGYYVIAICIFMCILVLSSTFNNKELDKIIKEEVKEEVKEETPFDTLTRLHDRQLDNECSPEEYVNVRYWMTDYPALKSPILVFMSDGILTKRELQLLSYDFNEQYRKQVKKDLQDAISH